MSRTSKGPADGALSQLDDALFKTAFHSSPAMQSVVRAADHILVEVNDTFLKKLGFAREEVIGKTPFDLNFWVEPEKLMDIRAELQSKGFVQGREVRLRNRGGEILTVLLSTRPVGLDGVPHFLSAGVDITPRKQIEAKLVESEARFSTAFHASPVIMTIGRLRDEKLVEVNEAFSRLLGMSRDQVIGRNTKEMDIWVDLEERVKFYEMVRRDRVIRNVDCHIRGCDGVVHTMQISGEIIEINGEPHLITFAVDITERRRAETEMRQALEKERELHQLKSDFVSLVSHEFRTPLEIIMSSADNLDRYHERLPAEKRQQLLRTIHKSVRRMSGMMEEVLVLGRLEQDRMTFKPAAFDLRSFCQRVCDEIESITSRQCAIDFQVNDASNQAFGDESILRHIFTNLLSNAVKYSQPDQLVHLRVQRAAGDAIFKVEDRGCGIPAADQKRIFQAFHRGANVRQIPGTGLGLLIVRRCVDLHGGQIEFQSIEGQGTTFTVTLPLFVQTEKLEALPS